MKKTKEVSTLIFCFENFDLFYTFSFYLTIPELLQFERVNHSLYQMMILFLQKWIQNPIWFYLHYKQSIEYITPKQRIVQILYQQHHCSFSSSSASSSSATLTSSAALTASASLSAPSFSSSKSNHNQMRSGFLIIGSNFDSWGCSTLWMEDCSFQFHGRILPNLTFDDGLGYFSLTTDEKKHDFYLLGGWSEFSNQASQDVFTFPLPSPLQKDRFFAGKTFLSANPLNDKRCLLACTSTNTGDLVVAGGCDDLPYDYRVHFLNTCLFKPSAASSSSSSSTSSSSNEWLEHVITPMTLPRCGHNLLTLLNNNLMILGGCHSLDHYSQSVEYYDWEKNQWFELASMNDRRSGFVSVVGPYGSVYAVGGYSSRMDMFANASCERYDPREGKWEVLPPMNARRGFTAGAIGASGILYVCGGVDNIDEVQGGIECFDFRNHHWFDLPDILSNPPMLETDIIDVVGDKVIESTTEFIRDSVMIQEEFSREFKRCGHQMMYVV